MKESASERRSRPDNVQPRRALASSGTEPLAGQPRAVWVVTHYRMFVAVFSSQAGAEACRDRLLAEDRASFDPTSPWTGPTYEPPVIDVVEALLDPDPIADVANRE